MNRTPRARTGARRSSPLDILTEDAWAAILPLLPLKALAFLAASSRALHILVGRQPEAVWKAAAAGDPAYLRGDALHRAPCILVALQTGHRVHRNLGKGKLEEHAITLPAGLASCDRCQHAVLHRGAGAAAAQELRLHDLLSGALVQRWPLPRCRIAGPDTWRWGSQALAMPVGMPAARGHQPAAAQPQAEGSGARAGLLLLDTASGACTSVGLQDGGSHLPPLLSDWGPTGTLLVQHARDANLVVHAFDAAGRIGRLATMPRGSTGAGYQARWAPDGQLVLLFERRAVNSWLWDFSRAEALPEALIAGTHGTPSPVTHAAWSPDSSRLLFLLDRQVVMWVRATRVQTHQVVSVEFECPVWGIGSRVAIMGAGMGMQDPFEGLEGNEELEIYQGVDKLDRVATENPEDYKFLLGGPCVLSPNGALVAVATIQPMKVARGGGGGFGGFDDGFGFGGGYGYESEESFQSYQSGTAPEFGVAVVSMVAGRTLQQMLLDFEPAALQWRSEDSAALLVSDRQGSQHVMFKFA